MKSLKLRKYRDLSGQYLIEGVKIIQEAIDNDIAIGFLLLSSSILDDKVAKDIVDIALAKGIPVYEVDEIIFREIAMTKSSQGLMGVVDKPNFELDSLLRKDKIKVIILNEIQDPGNLGTLIRTADACDFDCVVLSKGCVDVYNDKVVRATMGSLFRMPIMANIDIDHLIEKLHSYEIATLGADPYGDVLSFNLNYKGKNAIIVGNESSGLPKSIMDKVTYRVKIPMPGRAESLNAAIAASILMYEVIRGESAEKSIFI